ncbi:MAG TPA: phosphodiester glycosidase family protein, partial [Gemmatimonadaceae bacterium]|nr:phosphodiester glycosidase family protein [Gemmatimonadaceae bacterium]
LPSSALRVKVGSAWHTWWRSETAPVTWSGSLPLAQRLRWRAAAPGVEWAEIQLAGTGEAWRTRLVVARLDPARVRLALDTASAGTPRRPAWDVAGVADDALFAVNAGQFLHTMPWGLVVLDGRELLPAGTGPLSSALSADASGRLRWSHGDASRAGRDAAWAFQSYPTLLRDGVVPEPLRADHGLIDVAHRDARAAVGTTADGRLLVALTRFDALGGRLSFVPFGLTIPEMAAVMGALGARDAMMLDGGISAQMLIRDGSAARMWRGSRKVPLGLVALQRR